MLVFQIVCIYCMAQLVYGQNDTTSTDIPKVQTTRKTTADASVSGIELDVDDPADTVLHERTELLATQPLCQIGQECRKKKREAMEDQTSEKPQTLDDDNIPFRTPSNKKKLYDKAPSRLDKILELSLSDQSDNNIREKLIQSELKVTKKHPDPRYRKVVFLMLKLIKHHRYKNIARMMEKLRKRLKLKDENDETPNEIDSHSTGTDNNAIATSSSTASSTTATNAPTTHSKNNKVLKGQNHRDNFPKNIISDEKMHDGKGQTIDATKSPNFSPKSKGYKIYPHVWNPKHFFAKHQKFPRKFYSKGSRIYPPVLSSRHLVEQKNFPRNKLREYSERFNRFKTFQGKPFETQGVPKHQNGPIKKQTDHRRTVQETPISRKLREEIILLLKAIFWYFRENNFKKIDLIAKNLKRKLAVLPASNILVIKINEILRLISFKDWKNAKLLSNSLFKSFGPVYSEHSMVKSEGDSTLELIKSMLNSLIFYQEVGIEYRVKKLVATIEKQLVSNPNSELPTNKIRQVIREVLNNNFIKAKALTATLSMKKNLKKPSELEKLKNQSSKLWRKHHTSSKMFPTSPYHEHKKIVPKKYISLNLSESSDRVMSTEKKISDTKKLISTWTGIITLLQNNKYRSAQTLLRLERQKLRRLGPSDLKTKLRTILRVIQKKDYKAAQSLVDELKANIIKGTSGGTDHKNAAFTEWSTWSACSATCGVARSERKRHCIARGRCIHGDDVHDVERRPCVVNACPETTMIKSTIF